ncbi:membrane protein insertion efficiency factor YidD [Phosphitispora sp. TUW77]|uniref:membrane protein insertion efficiency factor YidD n=1 Tax=Phosphitispora sp. TUW77 TaxID=3152361 RepID=UPI003AB8A95C
MMRKLVIWLIRFYQKVLSPMIPSNCRFYPTCSEYALQSVVKYGVIKGTLKSLLRILRCHPFNPGGYDPVK